MSALLLRWEKVGRRWVAHVGPLALRVRVCGRCGVNQRFRVVDVFGKACFLDSHPTLEAAQREAEGCALLYGGRFVKAYENFDAAAVRRERKESR